MNKNEGVIRFGFWYGVHTKKVLFICAGNSSRSQMAEAIFNHFAPPSWIAVSAGIKPSSRVSQRALRALSEIGIEHSNARPKQLSNEIVREANILIGVCSISEVCLTWPQEKNIDYWAIPDPYSGDDEASTPRCRQARDLIRERVSRLLEELKGEN